MRNRSMSRHAMLCAVIFLCLGIAAAPLMLLGFSFFDRHRKVNRRFNALPLPISIAGGLAQSPHSSAAARPVAARLARA
jgi:hypothetical protein